MGAYEQLDAKFSASTRPYLVLNKLLSPAGILCQSQRSAAKAEIKGGIIGSAEANFQPRQVVFEQFLVALFLQQAAVGEQSNHQTPRFRVSDELAKALMQKRLAHQVEGEQLG